MLQSTRLFKVEQSPRPLSWREGVALVLVLVLVYAGVRLAFGAPEVIAGPTISLAPRALPGYALLSLGRMAAAYALSMLFSLAYGYYAATHPRVGAFLLPLLDVLQSVPILSFLPVVLLSLSAFLPQGLATELAAIVLIFTSQVWNITFAWYQSLTTEPKELGEASTIFRFNGWLRLKTFHLPFAALGLIWNSIMSWAGGWFFLMAAEIFTVGERDFRLPGLGAYLREAAHQGNLSAIGWGLGTLVLAIIALDQLVWRPLLTWADRFKLEMVESDTPPTSWFYDLLRGSALLDWCGRTVVRPLADRLDSWLLRHFPMAEAPAEPAPWRRRLGTLFQIVLGLLLVYGALRAGQMLITVPVDEWRTIALGVLATFLRVAVALAIALLWTVPVGVAIGTNPRLATLLQPVAQIAASVPATALFPVFLMALVGLPGGLNIAAVLLMLMGTQWYLLFNVIAGASAIPQDLKYTSALMQLKGWQRWRTLVLPALFPYIITGLITASGGAWNASIVAEHLEFGGQMLYTTGIGALIAQSTAAGDYPLLLASTLSMIVTVVTISRLVWRRLYRLAEERYRLE